MPQSLIDRTRYTTPRDRLTRTPASGRRRLSAPLLHHSCTTFAHHAAKRMSEVQRYTRADVGARSGRNNGPVWIIYKDSVYDVTSYVGEHPGGDVILEEAGKDATKAFEEVGHSSDARAIFAKFKIGEIVEEEKVYDANGKKKKRVVAAQTEENSKSCISVISCGLLG